MGILPTGRPLPYARRQLCFLLPHRRHSAEEPVSKLAHNYSRFRPFVKCKAFQCKYLAVLTIVITKPPNGNSLGGLASAGVRRLGYERRTETTQEYQYGNAEKYNKQPGLAPERGLWPLRTRIPPSFYIATGRSGRANGGAAHQNACTTLPVEENPPNQEPRATVMASASQPPRGFF
jgi:hypothetical protein